ncbi:MAG: hypothetical protein IJD60_08610 [Clostridia bacterium]|nr:hypothetical protein [Clostridia bacterium]
MPDLSRLRAVGMMAARKARETAPQETANGVIDLAPLLAPWKEGAHNAGEIVLYKGYPYRVVQMHDSTGSPGWNPEEARSLFAPYHGTDAKHALAWRQPTGAHDAYMENEFMTYGGQVYRCTADGTVHDPGVLAAGWEAIMDV